MPPTSNNNQENNHETANNDTNNETGELVVNLIRQKLNSIYEEEPSAKKEMSEIKTDHGHLSKHQRYMDSLSRSGKSLAEIQTSWHNYYINLPDSEKNEVWREFYQSQGHITTPIHQVTQHQNEAASQAQTQRSHNDQLHVKHRTSHKRRTAHKIKHAIVDKISHQTGKKKSHHRKSLLFGLSMGSLSLVIMMFGFFNERFIAPFITPSKIVNSTPIIIDSNTAVGPEPRVIIPKINVDIPVVYDEPSVDEKAVQRALQEGTLHYGITAKPGEKGNAVIFGHSSNNILNSGKYKFAFVLLNKLEPGDTFMLHKDSVRYVYKIYEKRIVKPDDLSVLNATDRPAVATLITCDPPGTSINRLVVTGEQISPSPDKNTESTASSQTDVQPTILPSNAPSLWQRFIDWLMH